MRLTFDLNNRVEKPTIILAKRNYDIIGELNNYTDASYDYNLNSSNNISFCIYNTDDTNYWDEVKDRRLIWIKELSEWFEITVKDTEDEKGTARKDIEGVSLCEAELSQILVVNTEINTEKDIDRKDYEVTVFYKPENPKASMLHRILKKAPHYSIGHVDDSLKNIQRSFSLNSKSIYDVLTGDIAEEIGCLFLFDSNTRTINVYDLETNCLHCGHRESFNDYCPECGSDNLDYGYGIDTTILVDNETLGKTISLESKADEYKNYFKLTAGDDYMTDTVMSCNPNGSPYIYSFPQSDKDDMSNELVSKLEEYTTVYNEQVQKYQDIMLEKYNLIDKRSELDSKMMPGDIHIPPTTTAKDELSKLRTESLSPVAVTDVSKLSVYTADNAVLSMAKCLINTSVFKLTIIKDSSELIGQTWKGRFHIENMSDEEDVADSEKDIIVGVNDDYQMFIKQKLDKTIDRNDPYLVDMFDNKVSLDDFKAELKKYCYKRLDSFENAYGELLDAMQKAGIADNSTYGDIHNDLYLPYFNKLKAIQDEKTIRGLEIKEVDDKLSDILKQQKDINDKVNLEKFLGDTLYKELCMFIREDEYSNSNYISDGLDNAEIFKKAKEFFNVALKEISKASTPQWTLSATLNDFLALPEFKPLWSSFNGGNWIRVKIDDKIFRLRLVHYTIDFENLETLNVEFSDVTITSNGLNDIQNVLEQAKSMATSFSYIAHQSEQGSSSFTELDKIRNDGLNASLYNIATSENQEFTIDSHGITGRYFDDIENDYSPEQVKFNNNSIVFTDNNWETAKTALGKITYENPFSGIPETKYGLLADAVIAGILMGNDIIGGNIYSENYSSTTGTHLNLNNGDFSFAGGKLVYDSADNKMTLKGVTIEWDSSTPPEITDINGLNEQLDGIDKYLDQLDGRIQTYSQTNDPSVKWNDTDKQNHTGDLWYNPDTSITQRWNGTVWDKTTDSDLAILAQSKAQIFTSTPTIPYYEGDLWVQGSTGDILNCITTKTIGSYSASDWVKSSKYTDDTALTTFINGSYKDALSDIETQIDGKARSWYQSTDPSLTWDKSEDHEGDLWYNTSADSHVTYIYQNSAWRATDVPKTLFDTIDGIASIYVTVPSNPVVGDLLIPTSDTENYKSGKVYKYDGSTWIEISYTDDTSVNNLDTKITQILSGDYKTTIGEDYVISPYIAGGYLYISDNKGSVLIDPQGIKNSDHIFSISNSSNSIVMGVDINGNGIFEGKVTSNSGKIGGWNITSSSLYNGTNSMSSTIQGTYIGTSGIRQYNSSSAYVNIQNGVLTADGAIINSGKIGGWTLSANAIYSRGESQGGGHGNAYYTYIQPFLTTTQSHHEDTWVISSQYANFSGGEEGTRSPFWYITVAGEIYSEGQIRLNSKKYPQIYGNDSYLHINYSINTSSGLVLESSSIRPAGDGSQSLGSDNHKWGQIYSSNSVISTSDRNEKNTVNTLDEDLSEKFIMSLNPVSYKYNNGTSDRLHYGLISQDVENSLNQLNIPTKDFAGFIKSPKTETNYDTMEETIIEGEYNYGLRYEEFIAPLIKLVQVQENRIKKLEEEIKKVNNN